MIDLHVHTTCSDGSLTPAEVVAEANARGVRTLAICDHDTADAYDQLPTDRGALRLVPGIELSVQNAPGTFHLLGYLIDPTEPGLRQLLTEARQRRVERIQQITAMLAKDGYPIDWAMVQAEARGGSVGRPHVASILLRAGTVASVNHAFDTLLGRGCRYYLPKRNFAVGTLIDAVHAAGGAAVLAHPYQLRLDEATLAAKVADWVDLGLDGIEAYYSQHTPEQVACYQALAASHRLCVTAGSDYHGARKPHIQIGDVPPGTPPADQLVAGLEAAAARWR